MIPWSSMVYSTTSSRDSPTLSKYLLNFRCLSCRDSQTLSLQSRMQLVKGRMCFRLWGEAKAIMLALIYFSKWSSSRPVAPEEVETKTVSPGFTDRIQNPWQAARPLLMRYKYLCGPYVSISLESMGKHYLCFCYESSKQLHVPVLPNKQDPSGYIQSLLSMTSPTPKQLKVSPGPTTEKLVFAPASQTFITGSTEKANTLTIGAVRSNSISWVERVKQGGSFLSRILIDLRVTFIYFIGFRGGITEQQKRGKMSFWSGGSEGVWLDDDRSWINN